MIMMIDRGVLRRFILTHRLFQSELIGHFLSPCRRLIVNVTYTHLCARARTEHLLK